MGIKEANKSSLLPEEDVLPLCEYSLCGRSRSCEKPRRMMRTSRTTGGCLSLFPLAWMSGWEMPGQAFPFSLAQNPSPLQITSFCLKSYPHPWKTLCRHTPYRREGPEVVHSWYKQLLLCWEAVHWGEESERKYVIPAQWILTSHTCMCLCIYVCMLTAHVTQGCIWGLFFLLLSILLQFSSETGHLIFWITESVAATAILQIGQRHTFYGNWELNLNFPKVWDVSIHSFLKRLYYSEVRASCKDWIHIQKCILKCVHFLVERSFKTCQAENNTLFVCCLTILLQIDPIGFFW